MSDKTQGQTKEQRPAGASTTADEPTIKGGERPKPEAVLIDADDPLSVKVLRNLAKLQSEPKLHASFMAIADEFARYQAGKAESGS